MESPFYGLQPSYPLEIPSGEIYDRELKRYVPTGTALKYEIFAEVASSRDGGRDEPGLERTTLRLACQVVKSPGSRNLLLPLKAGDTFELKFRGRPGEAEVLPIPGADLPGLPEEFGEEFAALWTGQHA